MRIAIITMRHAVDGTSPVMQETVQLLADWGATVDLIYPEERLINLASVEVEHDLYILKSGSELALSLAGALDAAGAVILNPYRTAMMMRDKVIASKQLQAAGVPTPDTFTTAHPKQLSTLLDGGPLVIKPHRGSQGRGVHIIWDSDELDNVGTSDGLIFAQRYYKPEGRDRKIYCIGGHLFGVMRVWPARSYQEKVGEPFTITPELREVALRCGRAFGVDLFGIDIIISDGRALVVDINSFPGFKGVPDAALRLADYVYAACQRAVTSAALPVTNRSEIASEVFV